MPEPQKPSSASASANAAGSTNSTSSSCSYGIPSSCDIPASPTPRHHPPPPFREPFVDDHDGAHSREHEHTSLPKFRPHHRALMARARQAIQGHCAVLNLSAPPPAGSGNGPEAAQQGHVLELQWQLDEATGIIGSDPAVGTTISSCMGCKVLPLSLVRGVEYEGLARVLNWTEMDISKMKDMLNHIYHHHHRTPYANVNRATRPCDMYVGDITDMVCAKDYLIRASITGNRYAKRLLNWLEPHTSPLSTNILQSPVHAMKGFADAIKRHDRERAIKLGRMIVAWDGGQWWNDIPGTFQHQQQQQSTSSPSSCYSPYAGAQIQEDLDKRVKMNIRPDATMIIAMRPREQKAMSANNIGFLLHHGNKQYDLDQDIGEAMRYYEMAIAWGSSAAACNLAHLYHHIFQDGKKAKGLYELALERGEREFSPRNIASLFQNGAPDFSINVAKAAHWLIIGIVEGGKVARGKCRTSLKILVGSMKFRFLAPPETRRRCHAVLGMTDEQLKRNGSGLLSGEPPSHTE